MTDRAAIEAWQHYLAGLEIEHSGVAQATFGFALGYADPDGIEVLFYSRHAD